MTLWQWLAVVVVGGWSRIEVGWTIIALLGLILNTVKLWLVLGDLRAALELRRVERTTFADARVLAAWWVAANAIKDELMLVAFVLIGWIAGQFPSRPVDGTGVAASVLTGLALLTVEGVTLIVVAFTLWARIRLGLPVAWRARRH